MLVTPFTYTHSRTGKEIILPAPADVVDPTGALRLILLIGAHTGRRFEAILQLRVDDVVCDVKWMREVLEQEDEEVGRHWANYFVNGVLNFRREWDKEDYHWPICTSLRDEIGYYLEKRGFRSGLLFPSERNATKPLSQDAVSKNPWTDPKTDA